MLRTGLSILLLCAMSGCASFIGDEPGYVDETGIEQSQNAQLKTEAAALRQAVREQQDELDQLNSGLSE